MRLYRFIDTDKKIDATVVTDGSCDQKRVFITEMRGIVPAGGLAVNEDEQAGSDALLALGFNWHVGHAVMHEELVAFAENNGLTLEINPQGLNELVAVEEWKYFLIPQKETLEFPKEGDSIEAVVTSYKQLYVNGKPQGNQTALSVKFQTEAPFTVSEGGTVTINENPSDTVRNGNLTITQDESGKTLNIVLSQEASIITYNYILTTNPSSLSFINTGETESINVTSTKQKVINGTPSGETIKALVTVELAGVGFSYEETDNGYDITVTENPGETQRTGTLTINQTDEGGKSVSVNLTQAASVITYDYTLTTDPTSLSFVAAGETKVFDVISNKQKKVNGKNSGSPIVVDCTTVVSGEGFTEGGFTEGSSEYSVIAAANTGAERTGQAVVTANEGGKTATITLTQLGV